ncbi:MAG TPA: hypothetical protein VMV49_15625 [Candidatus Deferrimicrobium sp.]|nr:hypothetical protein [Candidatus Deferrimicrobium sp.]
MPQFGLDNVLIGIVFFIFALQCLLIAREVNNKKKKEMNEENKEHFREGAYNGLLTSIILVAIGLLFFVPGLIVALVNNNIQAAIELPYPVPIATFAVYFLGFLFMFIAVFVVYEYFTKKYLTTPPPKQKIHKLDLEVSRKAYHILIIGILAVYLIVGTVITDTLYAFLSGDAYSYYGYATADLSVIDGGKLWVMFGVMVIFEFCILTDLIRVKAPRWYPARLMSSMYREKEKETLGPHVYLLAGILFAVIVFPAPIAMAVIAVSGLGDAVATIVGVTTGKHKIRPKVSKKSWEGCIAGMIASFVFGFIAFIAVAFIPEYIGLVGTIGRGIVIGLVINAVAVPVFFLIDYFTPSPLPFSDNLLNPLLIGFTMWGVYLLFTI